MLTSESYIYIDLKVTLSSKIKWLVGDDDWWSGMESELEVLIGFEIWKPFWGTRNENTKTKALGYHFLYEQQFCI